MAEGYGYRYRLERHGLRWHVHAGTGTRSLGAFWRWRTAERFRQELAIAFHDGMFVERDAWEQKNA